MPEVREQVAAECETAQGVPAGEPSVSRRTHPGVAIRLDAHADQPMGQHHIGNDIHDNQRECPPSTVSKQFEGVNMEESK